MKLIKNLTQALCIMVFFIVLGNSFSLTASAAAIAASDYHMEFDEINRFIKEVRDNDIFIYQYDESGICGFTLNDIQYYFEKDEDLNITSILDVNNVIIVNYIYDEDGIVSDILGQDSNGNWVDMSWDEDFIGCRNRIRLHSFYYDQEVQLYYNGLDYYNSKTNKYVGGTENLNEISTFEDFIYYSSINSIDNFIEQLDSDTFVQNLEIDPKSVPTTTIAQISAWKTSLMNNSDFGKPISASNGWYNDLADVEILARLIYGENNTNQTDQNAVAWVLINRKLANSSEFGYGFRNIATRPDAFSPISGSGSNQARNPNRSLSTWSNAVWAACTMLTLSSVPDYQELIVKPQGINTQKHMYSLTYFHNVATQGPTHIMRGTSKLEHVTVVNNCYNTTSLNSVLAVENKPNYNVFYNYIK